MGEYIDQRVTYLKRLLEDSKIIEFGITEAEIISLACRPITETLDVILRLNDIADRKRAERAFNDSNHRAIETMKRQLEHGIK